MIFRETKKGREVKSAIHKYLMYHLDCAPEGAVVCWRTTHHSCCAACYGALYQKPKGGKDND